MLTDFQNSFTDRLINKYVIKSYLTMHYISLKQYIISNIDKQ